MFLFDPDVAMSPSSRGMRVALARTCTLVLLSGLVACTGSPATLATQPDFEVMTAAGLASVSIRQSPPEMTDAEFTRLVIAGMARAAPDRVIADRPLRPFPAQRIVWHVDLTAARGASRLVVNVFDGTDPYAYEDQVVTNDTPPVVIACVVQSMSERLLADVANHANISARPTAAGTDGSQGLAAVVRSSGIATGMWGGLFVLTSRQRK